MLVWSPLASGWLSGAIREGKERGVLLDVSQHRELRTLIVLDDGHMVASFLPAPTIVRRLADPAASLDEHDTDE